MIIKESINKFLKDEPCRQCEGSGKVGKIARDGMCPLCRGVGREPNQLGKDLKEFLSLHYPGRI